MRVMIFGAGGLGAVVADLVRACGHDVTGFVDVDDSLMGREVEPGGARVLLNDDDFFEILEDEPDFDAVALAIADNKVRQRLFFELNDLVALPPFCHPLAVVSRHASIGAASLVMPLAVVNSAATVGRGSIIGAGAVIDGGANVGDAVMVGSNAIVCRGVAVEDRVHVGEGLTYGSAADR